MVTGGLVAGIGSEAVGLWLKAIWRKKHPLSRVRINRSREVIKWSVLMEKSYRP
jgi:hypothetical protein